MMQRTFILSSFLLLILVMFSCHSGKEGTETGQAKEPVEFPELDFSQGPPLIIYKTRSNYFDKVPVTLSEDKTIVSAFPHPRDLMIKGELTLPLQLEDGYLLDRRGIDAQVAFLSLSYKEYSNLEKAPSTNEILSLVIDTDPLLEFYNCGMKGKLPNKVEDLNILINNGLLDQCKGLKK